MQPEPNRMIRHTGGKIAFQPRIRKGAFFEAAWRYGCRTFSVYNRTYAKTEEFLGGLDGEPLQGFEQLADFVASIKRPRKVLLMVKAGGPTAATIESTNAAATAAMPTKWTA